MNESIKEKIKNLEIKYENLNKRVSNLESNNKKEVDKKYKAISINEFLIKKSPSSFVDKVVCFGFFIEHYKNIEHFNVDEIKNYFKKAKEKLPANLHDQFNKAVRRGLIKVKGQKDKKTSYILTKTGNEYVKNNLNKK